MDKPHKPQTAHHDDKTDAAKSPSEHHAQPGAEQHPGEAHADKPQKPRETGGPSGPEPTRYGDWERKGRCIDF